MTFFALVARIGLAKFAARLGVKISTVKRWLSEGEPSFRYQPLVAEVARRHLTSVKAAATRRKKQQETLSHLFPEESELTPEQALPSRLPGQTAEGRKEIKREGIPGDETTVAIESSRNIGFTFWKTIGKPAWELVVSELTRIAVSVWQQSGLDYVAVKFLFFRYIPFNPIYTGEMIRKQGHWVEAWMSTKAVSSATRLGDYIKGVVDEVKLSIENLPRIVFLESMGVSVFNRRWEVEAPVRRPRSRRKR